MLIEPDFARLAQTRVGVLGLGLMGGSLALALRGHVASVHGIDLDKTTVDSARQRLDLASTTLSVFDGDALILATPIRVTLEIIPTLTDVLPPGAVLLDLCSTKTLVVSALGSLPASIQTLGGHPICGKETSGFAHADPAIFHDAPFVLTPLPRTSPETLALARALVLAIGARPVLLDPETHDRLLAVVSHLPHLAAAALLLAAEAEGRKTSEVSRPTRLTDLGSLARHDPAPRPWDLAGPGFRDTTRLAASSLDLLTDILLTNRQPILDALSRYRLALDALADSLTREDEPALRRHLHRARQRRLTLNPES